MRILKVQTHNLLSLLIGFVAGIITMFGIVPLVGRVNWFVLTLAGFGLLLGLISGRREGWMLNMAVLAIALVRLLVGGGLI